MASQASFVRFRVWFGSTVVLVDLNYPIPPSSERCSRKQDTAQLKCEIEALLREIRSPKGCSSQCQDPDLNWGHGDFQSPALPTELSRHVAFTTCES